MFHLQHKALVLLLLNAQRADGTAASAAVRGLADEMSMSPTCACQEVRHSIKSVPGVETDMEMSKKSVPGI